MLTWNPLSSSSALSRDRGYEGWREEPLNWCFCCLLDMFSKKVRTMVVMDMASLGLLEVGVAGVGVAESVKKNIQNW